MSLYSLLSSSDLSYWIKIFVCNSSVKYSTNELCDRMDIWLSDTLKTAIQPTPPCLTVQKEEPSTSTDINDGKRKTDKELRREQKAAKKQKLQSYT